MKHAWLCACLFLAHAADARVTGSIGASIVIPASTTVAAMVDKRYVFGRRDGRLLAWDGLTGDLIASVPGDGGAVDPKTETAILGGEVWDLRHREKLFDTGLPDKNARAGGFTADGRYALIGAPETQVWDVKRRALLAKVPVKIARPAFLALSEEADYLAVGDDERFDIIEIAAKKVTRTGETPSVLPDRSLPTKSFKEFAGDRSAEFFVAYERTTAAGDSVRRPLRRVDWEKGKIDLFEDVRSPTGLVAHPQGNEVLVRWTAGGKTRAVLKGHRAPVTRIAYSPDHWSIATGDKDGDVRLWDAQTGELTDHCRGGAGEIVSLSFSPDGQYLLAASRDEIRVYPIAP